MRTFKTLVIIILLLSLQKISSQLTDPFLYKYSIYKSYNPEKAKTYKDIDGSPYLNEEFVEAILYFKDTTSLKIPLRYNIYTECMEYQLNGINYVVTNPQTLNKILLGKSEFVYLPFILNGGYFELLELSKCTLVKKRKINYKPSESKSYGGIVIPARFSSIPDIYYLVVNDSVAFKIIKLKSVKNALKDKKIEIENFIKTENIKNVKKENLIKIARYYNSL